MDIKILGTGCTKCNHLETATVSLGRIDPRIEARERARGEEIVRAGAYDEDAIYTLRQDEAQATLAHLRPGDVLGALTAEAPGARNFTREQIGKITVTDQSTYIAVVREIAGEAVRKLATGKVKGKTVKVRVVEN